MVDLGLPLEKWQETGDARWGGVPEHLTREGQWVVGDALAT